MSTPEATTIRHENVTDASGNINVRLTWPPPYDGGYPITSYRIQYSLINNIDYVTYNLILANTPEAINPITRELTHTLTNLIKGGIYQARISALNGFGSGAYSNFIYAYPGTVPSTLDVINSEAYASRGSTEVTIYWIRPYDGGYPILGYALRFRSVTLQTDASGVPIQSSIQELTPWTDPPIDLSANTQSRTVTDLLNGTYYQFQVAARNDVGLAPFCDPILVKPGDIPGPFFGNISANFLSSASARNNGRIFLEWSPPAYNGGYDLENYIIQYKSVNDVYYTRRVLPLTQRQITNPAMVTPDFSLNNIIVDYYGDLSSNPPIPIQSSLTNDVSYNVRIGVENDVGIRWLPDRVGISDVYATVIPGTFAKPVMDLSATIADGTTKLSWTWNQNLLNNGYPFANYYVVRYRPYNDLYWHQLVYPQSSEKLNINATVSGYLITTAETGRGNVNPELFPITKYQNVAFRYTNAVRDTSTNIYNYLDPSFAPFQAQQQLMNGVPYDFQVAAVNHITRGLDMGIAIGQYAQTRQIPGRIPDAPALFKIQRETQRAVVTWSLPISDGGYAITGYRIRVRPRSCLSMPLSGGVPALTNAAIATAVSSYNRQGVGVSSKNTSFTPAIAARYTDVSANSWNSTVYTVSTTAGNTFQLPFRFFLADALFDVAICASNALGFGPELFMSDRYSTKAYKPDAPINLSGQLIKSASLKGGSGAIFMSWNTPSYYGGNFATAYSYEIQYALTETTPATGDESVWFPLDSNRQIFGVFTSPNDTLTPKTVITALYSIYASASGMIGSSFIQWVRVRATAKSNASGDGGLSDTASDWAVAGVTILD
jgi:hypothetical protein